MEGLVASPVSDGIRRLESLDVPARAVLRFVVTWRARTLTAPSSKPIRAKKAKHVTVFTKRCRGETASRAVGGEGKEELLS